MKGMPLPFDFEGKEVLLEGNFSSSQFLHNNEKWKHEIFLVGSEPTSVLDNISSSPSPPTSTSTLYSSLCGGAKGGGTGGGSASTGYPSKKWPLSHSDAAVEALELHPSFEMGTGEKCELGLEDWAGVLRDSMVTQDPSMLRWIMGEVEDPSMGLNKLLQIGGGSSELESLGGFTSADEGRIFDPIAQFALANGNGNFVSAPNPNPSQNPLCSPILLSNHQLQHVPFEDVKPQVFNYPEGTFQFHQQQAQNPNPAMFLPMGCTQEGQLMPPQPKRQNHGDREPVFQFLDSGQEPFPQPPLQVLPHQHQLLPPYMQPRPTMAPKAEMIVGNEFGHHNQNQVVMDQLYKAAELVQTGNLVHAQGILARLNHQLSSIGKPFHRAAFYCKEALQLLLNDTNNSIMASPFTLIFKIGAYKSFSEISPVIQFASFTCNQALLEALNGYHHIHIIDFDIGYGGQWASLMQELALRSGGAPSLKITTFANSSVHDQLELSLTRENLSHFASEINMPFDFEIVGINAISMNPALWSFLFHSTDTEAIAVNLPSSSYINHQLPLPLVLRFIKQLSPKIVVSVDRGCDRTDLPFPNHLTHALQSYSNLLESLDAANVNMDILQKIERFLIQPGIEKVVMERYRCPEKMQHWRTAFLSAGFSPLIFSNFNESQAECVVKRTHVRGFHIEKRQASLVLCWQRKELMSASAWRC
ncbi:hypothetical protein LguiB_023548 [Lonicera macranthoides]